MLKVDLEAFMCPKYKNEYKKFLFVSAFTIWMMAALFFSGCILHPDVLTPISAVPRIESVQTIKIRNGRNFASSSFRVGEKENFIVVASDSDKDIDALYVKAFAPNNKSQEPNHNWEALELEPQTKKIARYSLPEPIEAVSSSGKWRIDIQVKDKKKNMSNVYTLYVIAH